MPLDPNILVQAFNQAKKINNQTEDNSEKAFKIIAQGVVDLIKSGDVTTVVTAHTTGKGKVT